MSKIIVYTATAGGRDSKVRPPHYTKRTANDVYRYVAYTDGGVAVDNGWIHRPSLESDIWAALLVRCLPHVLFPKAAWTIYHDNSIVLRKDERGDPANLLRMVTDAGGIVGARMQMHADTLAEAIERERILAPERHGNNEYDASGQLDYYKRYPRVATKRQPVRGGLLIRRNCDQVNDMNEKWWDQVKHWQETTNQAALTAALQITGLYDDLVPIPREAAVGKGHK